MAKPEFSRPQDQALTPLFIRVPNKKELCCVVGSIKPEIHYNDSDFTATTYQWKVIKCRKLVLEVPEIIASPIAQNDPGIFIIAKKEYYKSQELACRLEQIGLQIGNYISLTDYIYEACIQYTVAARVAPCWIQLGNYLAEAQEVFRAVPANAVKLTVEYDADDGTFVIVWPVRVKLPRLKTEKLESQNNNPGFTDDGPFNTRLVNVLPSLEEGYLVSVSKETSKSHVTHKKLQELWKRLYGYMIPPSEKGFSQCCVGLGPKHEIMETYPTCCVSPRGLLFLRPFYQKILLKSFMKKLNVVCPVLCGQEFGKEFHIAFAVPKTYILSDNLEESDYFFGVIKKYKNLTTWNGKPLCTANETEEESVCMENNTQLEELPEVSPLQNKQENLHVSEVRENQSAKPITAQPMQYVSSVMESQQCNIEGEFTEHREMNAHKLAFANAVVEPTNVSELTKATYANTTKYPYCGSLPRMQCGVQGQSYRHMLFSSVVPVQTNFHTPLMHTAVSRSLVYGPSTLPHSVVLQGMQLSRPPFKVIQAVHNSNMNMATKCRAKIVASEDNHSSTTEAPGAKKARTRPQIQPFIDVEAFARAKDLARVNTATLVNWLRNHSVPCKVKEKKSNLVDKVLSHLKIQ